MSDSDAPDAGENHSNEVSNLPGAAAFLAMGMTIAILIGIGVGLGIWADDEWGHAPLWLFIGLVLGTVAAVVSVKQQIRRFL
jgi:F0F1-type ATP synthase assembly protein I